MRLRRVRRSAWLDARRLDSDSAVNALPPGLAFIEEFAVDRSFVLVLQVASLDLIALTGSETRIGPSVPDLMCVSTASSLPSRRG